MDSRLRSLLLVTALGIAAYFFIFKKDTPQTITSRQGPPPPASVERGDAEQRVRIRSGPLTTQVSTYSGALREMRLPTRPYADPKTGEPFNLSTTWREEALNFRSDVAFERNGQNVLPPYLTYRVVAETERQVEMLAEPPGTELEVRRVVRAHTEFSLKSYTTIVNRGEPGRLRYAQNVYHWVKRNEESGGFFRQAWQLSEGLCHHHSDSLIRAPRDELSDPKNSGARQANFVGLGNLYFLYAMAPFGPERPDCLLRSDDRGDVGGEPTGSLLVGQLVYPPVQLASGESHEYKVIGYFGPKLGSALAAAAPSMREAVNLGFFALIARGLLKLLQFLNSIVHNWGIAIILLTVVVRTALYPILARSTKSMAVMQKLKPEIDALNEKYADNAEQKGLATMELYRKHKINPLAGCLPQFAQLPIWWALYTTLQTSVELFHAPFALWWVDLSAPDRFYVLPLVLGGVMFMQQKLMPPAMPDPVQAKIMLYFMPIFLTAISLFLPAGLALYMLVNSILAIIQQRITKAQIDKMAGPSSGTGIEVRPALATAEPGGAATSDKGGRRGRRR